MVHIPSHLEPAIPLNISVALSWLSLRIYIIDRRVVGALSHSNLLNAANYLQLLESFDDNNLPSALIRDTTAKRKKKIVICEITKFLYPMAQYVLLLL